MSDVWRQKKNLHTTDSPEQIQTLRKEPIKEHCKSGTLLATTTATSGSHTDLIRVGF